MNNLVALEQEIQVLGVNGDAFCLIYAEESLIFPDEAIHVIVRKMATYLKEKKEGS